MKIEVSMESGLVGGDRKEIVEIDQDELEGLSEEDITEVCDYYAREAFFNLYSYSWSEVED